ncbi:MAG: hypothetical protein AAFR98_08205 [Pseudomonadota bacterium]
MKRTLTVILISSAMLASGMGMLSSAPEPVPAACILLDESLKSVGQTDYRLEEGLSIPLNDAGISVSSCDAYRSDDSLLMSFLIRQDVATDRNVVPSAQQLDDVLRDTAAAMGIDLQFEKLDGLGQASAWVGELGQIVSINHDGRSVMNVGPGFVVEVSDADKALAVDIVTHIVAAYPTM